MATCSLFINNIEIKAKRGSSILEAARNAEIYIPSLCYHPDLPPSRTTKAGGRVYRGNEQVIGDAPEKEFEGCKLCLVEIEGETELVPACDTIVANGMKVLTDTEHIREARQEKLMRILMKHPHACLVCAQKEGCSRELCPTNVPKIARCCAKFGNCELEKVAEYVGIREDTPRYVPADIPVLGDEPLFVRDYNLCVGCTRCVRACRELLGVKALSFVYQNHDAFVGSAAPTLRDSACRFCTVCVEVCPTGALRDKGVKAGERELTLIPCKSTCPAEIDVPRYVNLIAQGRYKEAEAVVREKAPFASVLGHSCARFCEKVCRSREVNDPIAICALKRFAVDCAGQLPPTPTKQVAPLGKRIAIVGSGPSGLTAAYYLARLEHSVTVFETMPKLGGLMRFGVQEYRVPESVLQNDLERILNLGIDAKTNTPIVESLSIKNLKSEGYDAILLAIGLQKSRILPVEGADNPDVLGALDFLRDVRLGKDVEVKARVLIIGSGNVAMDAALTALRLGAKQVAVACRRKWEEMAAFPWEIQQAVEEGVKIHNSWGVKRVLVDSDGKVRGMELMRCVSVFDQTGKSNPSYDEGVIKTLAADMIIFATGQVSDLTGFEGDELKTTELGTVEVNNSTSETSVPGVFACGDIVNGASSIVDAVGLGRKAATAIHKYLGGKGNIDEARVPLEKQKPQLSREEGFAYKRRAEMPRLPVEKRQGNFAEVELGFDEKTAVEEARRCLRCDLRLHINQPMLPPEKWIRFDSETVANVPECEGVFQLLDEKKMVLYIKGAVNLRQELMEQVPINEEAKYFIFEQAKMFTMRESELLQQFMKKYGKMPTQNVGLEEDLY